MAKLPPNPPKLNCKKVQAAYSAAYGNKDGHGPIVPPGWEALDFRLPVPGDYYIPVNTACFGPVFYYNAGFPAAGPRIILALNAN